MLTELEHDFISERTKEGLNALKSKGIKLGAPIKIIIDTHLEYEKYLSLNTYIEKKIKNNL